MFNLVVLIFLAAWVGYLIGKEAKEWAAKSKNNRNDGARKEPPNSSIGGRLRQANPFALDQGDQVQFEIWINSSSNASKDFLDWYVGTDEKNQKAFVRSLAQFFESFGMKTAWLNDEPIHKSGSSLSSSVEEMVNDYSSTYLKATEIKSEAYILKRFQKWQDYPSSTENSELTEGIYANLVANSMIAASVSKKGSARKKREAMAQVINSYREENPQVFYTIFSAIATGKNLFGSEPEID
jgi:hypothetical protein